MKLLYNSDSLSKELTIINKDGTIGFVPTMGALHEGHLSLVRKALKENDCVVVSIFVNPTQFNNRNDLEQYPRMLKEDIELLETLKGNIFIYAPEITDLYPNKVESRHFDYGGIELEMEGKHRKGHFDGVGTIVSLLLQKVKPNNAYFGEKDFQQLQIIRKLVEMEKLSVNIVGCPIIREKNGLAKSSRNKLLTDEQRVDAAIISKTLSEVQKKFRSLSIFQLVELVKERFLRSSLTLEYFEIADENTLKGAKRKCKNKKYRAFIAAHAGNIRLIDNIPLN